MSDQFDTKAVLAWARFCAEFGQWRMQMFTIGHFVFIGQRWSCDNWILVRGDSFTEAFVEFVGQIRQFEIEYWNEPPP